jgi:long-subunit acyl-CoA synthetase (AMP-forming)
MEGSAAARPEDRDPVVAELDRLSALSGAEAAALVERVGDEAAQPSTAADRSAQLDAALVRALCETVSPDEILEQIDPVRLGSMLERCTTRAQQAGAEPDPAARKQLWDLLDLLRRPALLRRIDNSDVDGWATRFLTAIESSHLTVGALFRQRAEYYGSKTLFQVPQQRGRRAVSWRQAASRVERIARGLIALDPDGEPAPVAILCENRLDMALTDLACLTNGMIDVMVPANSTLKDVGFMLRHSKVRSVVVSDQRQLTKVVKNKEKLPDLCNIVIIDASGRRPQGVVSLDELIARAESVPAAKLIERAERVRIDDLATVMYTSGTTGTPKGIQFTQRNLVFKRFARALALPEIGENDVFLCFLPLFHTFGRYLEMLGCIFWGATYCFLENPSLDALVRGMKRYRPSVFISVPKRWIELHETITRKADPLRASDEELLAATRQVTGGRLRHGLSAAGYLDPDIFRFFQRQGVELCSGFGMTEATGGITMTPPGGYQDESLGVPLPGIEVRLAEDGEMLVRGPYVMIGYLDPPDGEPSFDEEGWLATGDLFEKDPEGHYRLVDRKKEIYKNVKGETIAPQRVENLFRDFDSVARVFLVGDHREYNVILIYPNPDCTTVDFSSMGNEEIRDHFRSLVVSVNKFLSPFERIVDFAVIDRDLDPDRGELTPKGTPRRQIVARNFHDVIRERYRRTVLRVGDVELIFPNWLFQEVGLTAQDIEIVDDTIVLPSTGAALTVRRIGEQLVQVGSCAYSHPHGPLNLGALLTSPRLWLGNEQLVDFVPLEPETRRRPGRAGRGLKWIGRVEPFRGSGAERVALLSALQRSEYDLLDLDRAARFIASTQERAALEAVDLLERMLGSGDDNTAEAVRLILGRAAEFDSLAVRRRAFQVLVPAERKARFAAMLERFLWGKSQVLGSATRDALCERNIPLRKIEAFVELAHRACTVEDGDDDTDRLAFNLLRFLSGYGAAHPVAYRRLRAFLVRMTLFARHSGICAMATESSNALLKAFRRWLGPSSQIAVDPETGEEYQWEDVIVFDEEVPDEHRLRLLAAIMNSAVLREAVFMFSKGVQIRLSDIPPGGVWIRLLGSRHGKSVYRATVQTRYHGHYDLAINVNVGMAPEQVAEEINWLILSGDPSGREPLVEDFGGYWEQHDLWSEEFISGETLVRAMRRLAKRRDEQDRLKQLWPFLAWTALSGYVDFWDRSGGLLEIADPSMSGVVVPTDDYHTGVRLVSVSARRPYRGLLHMLYSFMDEFIQPAVRQYPVLQGLVGWDVIFSSVLEVVGEDKGLALFESALQRHPELAEDPMLIALRRYVESVRVRGFLPRRLFFAAKRYRRWAGLSSDATREARARTLQELWDTYGLQRLLVDYPEARLRFFRETVFRDCPEPLARGLEELITKVRSEELYPDEIIDSVAELRSQLELGPDEDYFLARLSFPYLRPEDAADFVSTHLGGKYQSELVVGIEDHEGNPIRVRHALNPKEVGRLHRLFLSSKLDVRFRPEHQYLVAINERQQLIGGIYYEIEESFTTAHLEKIVVSDPYRRKGVADGLMHEFFNRLRAAGIKTVTTGFFRPQYFYAYGFKIEKRYAGLVKSLEEEDKPTNGAGATEATRSA